MSETFAGRKVVVVGGSSGMGLATAQQVLAGGGSAVITGRNPDKLRAAVETLSEHGNAWGIAAELTDRVQVLERLLTDDDRRLSREIDRLRTDRPSL